jgi:hypothetical protein
MAAARISLASRHRRHAGSAVSLAEHLTKDT